MLIYPRIILVSLLATVMAPDSEAVCKWTDANGTVHYAEKCPGDADASPVDIEPPPSRERIESSQKQSVEMRQTSQIHDSQRAQEKHNQSAENQATRNMTTAMLQQCAGSRWQLLTLREKRPVYMDENGNIYSNQSSHNTWYQGSRLYLDDARRAAEIERFEQIEEQTCSTDEADIREGVRMYMKNRNKEVCQQLEDRLARMQETNTGVPSRELRNLDAVVKVQCR